MPRMKLTKSGIDKLPLLKSGTVLYFDISLPGFGMRVGKTKKTFFAQRDILEKTYSKTIGTYGIWTPDEARKTAREILLSLSKGIDPDKVRKEQQAKEITLRELTKEFFKARKKLKDETKIAYLRNLKCHLPDWLDKPVTKITEESFSERYTFIGENKGETIANCVRRTLCSILNYGIASKKLFDKNPTLIIAETKSAYPHNRRRSYIKPHQLKAWYEAVNNLPNRIYRDCLLLILFTGLRRNEATSLRWSQIDFIEKSFLIEKTKNGEPLKLPLSDFLYDLLKERKKLTGKSPFVFPSTGKKGYLAEPKKGVEAVCKATGIKFTAHDLRRTFATIADSLDCSTYAIKALVNHKSSDITASYIIMSVERLRQPMQDIAKHIIENFNGKEK